MGTDHEIQKKKPPLTIKTGKNQKTDRCRAGHWKRRSCFKIRAK
jgi:hypothetical protein